MCHPPAAVGHEVGSGGAATPVAGHVEVDNSKATDKVTLYVTKDQADHMQSFINDASKQQQSYDFLYSNCATFVESTLGAGGVKAPNDMTPHGLVEDLKKLPQTAPPGAKQ